MEKKVCVVSIELMQKTVRYLETQPFMQVHQLIAELLKECNGAAMPVPEAPKEESAEAKAE